VGTDCEVRGCAGSAAEVAIDPETGEVEILKHINACDMGRALFWKGAEGQILSGIEHQVGQALFWELLFDPITGAVLNPSSLEHRWPTTLDYHQDKEEAMIVEPIDACGPYGAKGLGEPPTSSWAAITQAIHNATGKWFKEIPIYPWRILQELGKT
jgi:CO/xanthine dehydrogenase Mo-binding subunit